MYFNNVKSYKKLGPYLPCRKYDFEKTTRGQIGSLSTVFLGSKDELIVIGKHRYCHRPQVSRPRPRVSLKWVGRCSLFWKCLSNATLECISPTKRFSLKTVNEKKFLATQSLIFILPKNQWTLLKLTNTKNGTALLQWRQKETSTHED